MPAEFSIDTAAMVVRSLAWGTLTDKDLLTHQLRLIADKKFRPGMNQVFDFTEVTASSVTFDGVQIFADRNPFGAGVRRVFVVPAGAAELLKLLQKLATFLSSRGIEVLIHVGNIEGAKRWVQ